MAADRSHQRDLWMDSRERYALRRGKKLAPLTDELIEAGAMDLLEPQTAAEANAVGRARARASAAEKREIAAARKLAAAAEAGIKKSKARRKPTGRKARKGAPRKLGQAR